MLPEQAGYLLLRLLPLAVFSGLLRTLGLLARPLLLAAMTVVVVGIFTLGAVLLDQARARPRALAAGAVMAVMVAAIALGAATPGEALAVAEEALLLAGVTVLVYGTRAAAASSGTDPNRRRFLQNLLTGAVAAATLGIVYADVRRLLAGLLSSAGTRATTEITPVKDFYVVSKNVGPDPTVDPTAWRLILPDARALSYAELLAMPSQRQEVTFECISNEVGGALISNGIWQGPRVLDVLAKTAVPGDARYLLMESVDGYTESLPLAEITADYLLATHLNGQPLTPAHGFPARFVFPGRYGMKQPKWVRRLRFSSVDVPGFWEQHGWDRSAIVKTMSRIDDPLDGATLAAGGVRISGIAFAGARSISAVELSRDRSGWQAAELEQEFAPSAWRFWHREVPLAAGRHRIRVRARDGAGTLQTERPAPTLPNGADGWHAITLDVR